MGCTSGGKYLAIKNYRSLQRMARNGQVPAANYNRHWYFLQSELDAWRKGDVLSPSPSVPRQRRFL